LAASESENHLRSAAFHLVGESRNRNAQQPDKDGLPSKGNTRSKPVGHALKRARALSGTGNDEVSVNRKNKSSLSVRIPAKIVLVANKHPKFLDESGALADRELMLVFESSFPKVKDTELGGKLKAESSGIANWAIEGLRRLRANGNRFTIGERGRKAQQELAESQSPALRFANDCLVVTGDPVNFVPLDIAFAAYDHWATFVEQMGSREKRNRTDFRCDLMATLAERGVRYNQRRWRDPDAALKHGNGKVTRGLSGGQDEAGRNSSLPLGRPVTLNADVEFTNFEKVKSECTNCVRDTFFVRFQPRQTHLARRFESSLDRPRYSERRVNAETNRRRHPRLYRPRAGGVEERASHRPI
jgi:phage/plasmid-associated DNA primase